MYKMKILIIKIFDKIQNKQLEIAKNKALKILKWNFFKVLG